MNRIIIKTFGWVVFSLMAACSGIQKKESNIKIDLPLVQACSTAKEYVTTYNYLKSHQEDLGLSMDEIQKTSTQVAKGCEGAAPRFIKSFEVLHKVGLGGRSSLETGIALAQQSDAHSQAFLDIFKKSYLKNYLDLDIRTSFQMASDLSIHFQGEPIQAKEDFYKLTKFCTENKYTQLPLPTCAAITFNVIKKSEYFNKNIADDFITIFTYIRKNKHLQLNIKRALELTEEVIASGPGASENFKIAYEFGISQKGLNYSAQQALSFARNLVQAANDSYKKRMPATQN